MTLARRKLGSAAATPPGPEALELQRFANAGRLAAAVSNELLSALGMAHTEIGLLFERLPAADGDLRDAAADARSSLSRAAARIASVLSLARPRSMAVAPVDAAEVLEAALFDLEARLRRFSLQRDLRQVPPALADRGALLQTLVSLLLDAADAAQPRGRIRVSLREETGSVALGIEDDGPVPLAPKTLVLWICHNVVHSFGGELSARSGAMGGRLVTIRLPAA